MVRPILQTVHAPEGLFSTGSLSALVPTQLLDKPPRLAFDLSGIAGFLGADDAVSAMAAAHIYGNSQWLGWYNNPGSFHIANRLRSFANSVTFRTIFNNNMSPKSSSKIAHADPMRLFGLDNSQGPKFRAAHSGTVIEKTSHLTSLFMKECMASSTEGKVVPGRRSQPIGITIVDLDQAPAPEMHPARSCIFTPLIASIPIAISVGTCALCALCEDWYAASLILLGILASGIFCLVLGSAEFVFSHPEPAKGSPAGDGILSSDNDVVLLRGSEGAVNSITRGTLSLRFASKGHYALVRWCSTLFFIQAVTQLLLIPQASLFGQLMFLTSLGASAMYNAWLSSADKEKIHRKFLFERVLENPPLTKYTLGTRTAAVVFILLVLQPRNPTELLNELLPNDTAVWRKWKATLVDQLQRSANGVIAFESKVGDGEGWTQQEKDLLALLYDDAHAAFDGYRDYLRFDCESL